jgi:hypothetical protein
LQKIHFSKAKRLQQVQNKAGGPTMQMGQIFALTANVFVLATDSTDKTL